MDAARAAWHSLLSAIFPDRCVLCERVGFPPICLYCRQQLVPISPSDQPALPPDGLDLLRIGFHYSGRMQQAITQYKYGRSTALGATLADLVRQDFATFDLLGDLDVIAPVPIHWRRWTARGFNQTEILCSRLPRSMVDHEAISRLRFTPPQASLTLMERRTSLVGAFASDERLSGRRVLIVDDVYTSGSTVAECAKALRAAGAAWVGAYALASSLRATDD